MTAFVDTSALLALLDADDEHHAEAKDVWHRLADAETPLVTTNYVVVETLAVAQHRLGMDAVRALVREIIPLIDVIFMGEADHDAAVAALVAAGRRQLSLVDCASFLVMHHLHLHLAFTYDKQYAEQGFEMQVA